MNKLDYLKLMLSARAYVDKNTLISIVSIQLEGDENTHTLFKEAPYGVYVKDNQFYFQHEGKEEIIEGVTYNLSPLFEKDELLDVSPDIHPFIPEQMITTFGILLINIILFYDVFDNGGVTYINGEVTEKAIKDIISTTLVDQIIPTDEQARDPNWRPIYPPGKYDYTKVVEKFARHGNYLQGLDVYWIRSSCIEALSPSPAVTALKEELFALHKDELDDPVVFSDIVKQCVKLDMEEQMSSYNATFYTQSKFIEDNRKRMFIAFGIESDPESGTLVNLKRSLDEGVDMDLIYNYVNSTVSGAHDRGKATGEGGSEVKNTIQLLGGTKAHPNTDCGTKGTEQVLLTEYNKRYWLGSFFNNEGKEGGVTELTNDNVDKWVGKQLGVRTPAFCMQPNSDFCHVCLGRALGANADQMTAAVTRIPTNFMLTRMKSYHQAGRSSTKLDLKKACK